MKVSFLAATLVSIGELLQSKAIRDRYLLISHGLVRKLRVTNYAVLFLEAFICILFPRCFALGSFPFCVACSSADIFDWRKKPLLGTRATGVKLTPNGKDRCHSKLKHCRRCCGRNGLCLCKMPQVISNWSSYGGGSCAML